MVELDAETMTEWLKVYGQDVLRFIRFYTSDAHEAEDLTQEVFLRAYSSLPTFRRDCAPKTWLLRIALNVCRKHTRWKIRHPYSLVASVEFQQAFPSAEVEAMTRDDQMQLISSVMRLPTKLKDTILLHYFEEQSVLEVASTLGIGESAVKLRLLRARKRLKQMEGGRQDGPSSHAINARETTTRG